MAMTSDKPIKFESIDLTGQHHSKLQEDCPGTAEARDPQEREANAHEHQRQATPQAQDPHEWLLERYAGSALHTVVTKDAKPLLPTPVAHREGPVGVSSVPTTVKPRTPSPEVVAVLEQESEVINVGIVEDRGNSESAPEDPVTELATQTLNADEGDPAIVDVDVETTLLGLLDDHPSVPHPPRPETSGTPLKPSPSDLISTSPPIPVIPSVSPSSFVFPPDMLSSVSPVLPTHTPERGSMPPPSTTTTTSARSESTVPSKKWDHAGSATAVAGTKRKKEAVAKVRPCLL
jgi:hypothetical protein